MPLPEDLASCRQLGRAHRDHPHLGHIQAAQEARGRRATRRFSFISRRTARALGKDPALHGEREGARAEIQRIWRPQPVHQVTKWSLRDGIHSQASRKPSSRSVSALGRYVLATREGEGEHAWCVYAMKISGACLIRMFHLEKVTE